MATFEFPQDTIYFNFQAGRSSIPVLIYGVESYKELKQHLSELKILSVKKIPQYEVYKSDGTLVGTYLEPDTATKQSLIDKAGVGYITTRGLDKNYYDNVKNPKYPTYKFEYWLPEFELPVVSPNIFIVFDENDSRQTRTSKIRIEYNGGKSLTSDIEINQAGYYTEAYFMLLREGVDKLETGSGCMTSIDYGFWATYQGSPIPEAYIVSGKNKYVREINANKIAKIRLDDPNFAIYNMYDITCDGARMLYCGQMQTTFDKTLAILSYEGCSDADNGYLNIHKAQILDGTEFAESLSSSCRMIVLRNKYDALCNRVYLNSPNIQVDQFEYDDIAIINNPDTCGGFHQIRFSDEFDPLLLETAETKEGILTVYDVYHWGCRCTLTPMNVEIDSVACVKPEVAQGLYVNTPDVRLIAEEKFDSGCEVDALIEFSANQAFKVELDYLDLHSSACVPEDGLHTKIGNVHSNSGFNEVEFNTSPVFGEYRLTFAEKPDEVALSYFGATITNSKPNASPTVYATPVTYAIVSDEFNNDYTDPDWCGGGSGCISYRMVLGGYEVQRVYIGDTPVQHIALGDNVYYTFSNNDLRPINEEE